MLCLRSMCCCIPCLCCGQAHSTEKYKIFGELLLPLAQKGHCFDQPLQLILILYYPVRKMKVPIRESSEI